MLFQVLLYLYISFICFWSGCIFYGLLNRLNKRRNIYSRPLINYLVSGLILCTAFSQLAVLVMPLRAPAAGIYMVLLIILSFFLRREIVQQVSTFKKTILIPGFRMTMILLVPLILMVLVLNTGPTIMDDTDSYHIQMVKWIDSYGTVPGIANLHIRYGLNSSWFIAAGFFLPGTESSACLALNGVLSIWVCAFLMRRITGIFQTNASTSSNHIGLAAMFLLLLALINWPLLRGNAASLNYDFITTAMLLLLFFQLLEGKIMHAELFLWPCFLFSVRIINYPLLLLSCIVLVMFWNNGRKKQAGLLFIAGALLLLPFLARNIYLSGFPFFPLQFPLNGIGDWQADPAVMSAYVEFTRAFNRVNEQHQPIDKTLQLSFPDWIGYWYKYLFNWDKVMVTLAIAAIVLIAIRFTKMKKLFPVAAQWMLAAGFLQLVSWFIVSPDPRFVHGPLLFFIGAGLILILPIFNARQLRPAIAIVMVMLPGIVLIYTVRKIIVHPENRNWVTPLALPQPPVGQVTISGIDFHIPLKIEGNWNARCYNTSLPCLYKIHPALKPRGKDIREGFTIQQPPQR